MKTPSIGYKQVNETRLEDPYHGCMKQEDNNLENPAYKHTYTLKHCVDEVRFTYYACFSLFYTPLYL